ncbi:MAG: 2OG-Fe(II) oxygenase [Hyphomicrobiaceae bacterium]
MSDRPLERDRLDTLVEALARDGFAIDEDFASGGLVELLAAEVEAREFAGAMHRAAIGRLDETRVEDDIRVVEASWLSAASTVDAMLLAMAEDLRLTLNRKLFLGLFEFEAQYLFYPPGGFYARHLDSLAGARNRIVSFVLYLNRSWIPGDGGELDIWRSPEDRGAPAATVAPRAGTLVLMLSEEIPHCVRLSLVERRVVAGWFRLNASTAQRVDPAS